MPLKDYMSIERKADASGLLSLMEQFPIIFLTGPRRCGKTTLARSLEPSDYYLLSDPGEAERFVGLCKSQPKTKGIVAVDEIQESPDVLPLIRQWVDTQPDTRLLLLGSATFLIKADLHRHLLGRMAVYQVGGFTLEDVGVENLARHLYRGGFPESYLAPDEETSFAWRQEYIEAYPYAVLLRESAGVSPHAMGSLIRALPLYSGRLVNFPSISHDLEVSRGTVQRYLQILAASGLVRLLKHVPSSAGTTSRKSQKLYMRDSGLLTCLADIRSEKGLEGDKLASLIWEAYVMEFLAISLERRRSELAYWRDRTGDELDAVWSEQGRRVGVEISFSSHPHIAKAMKKAIETLQLSHLWVLHRGKETFPLAKQITAVPATQFLSTQQPPGPSASASSQPARSFAPQKKVFVSYSHQDEEFTRELVEKLESSGVNVTIDTQSLRLGNDISEFVRKAVRSTEWTIMIVSQSSLRSPWVMAEFMETILYERFQDRSRLIPVTIDDSVFKLELEIDIDEELQQKIDEVNDMIREELDRNMDIDRLAGVRQRLLSLKNNIGKALELMTSVLVGDFSNHEKYDRNFHKLIEALEKENAEK